MGRALKLPQIAESAALEISCSTLDVVQTNVDTKADKYQSLECNVAELVVVVVGAVVAVAAIVVVVVEAFVV